MEKIFSLNDTVFESITGDTGSLWVMGDSTEHEQFFMRMNLVRYPVKSSSKSAGILNMSTFSATSESTEENGGFFKKAKDVIGSILTGSEKSIMTVTAVHEDGTEISDVENACMIQPGQRRKITYNSKYLEESSSVSFTLSGNNIAKVDSGAHYITILSSSCDIGMASVTAEEKLNGEVIKRSEVFFSCNAIVLDGTENGVIHAFQYVPKKVKGKFVADIEPAMLSVAQEPYRLSSESRVGRFLKMRKNSSKAKVKNTTVNKYILPGEAFSPVWFFHWNTQDVKDWDKVDTYIYQENQIEFSATEPGEYTLDFALNSKGGEIIKETVKFHAVNIHYDSSYNQSYGFDEEELDENEYLSIAKGNETEVKVTVKPFVSGKLWVTMQDSSIVSVKGGTQLLTAEDSYVTLIASDTGRAVLQVNSIEFDEKVLKELNILTYKEKQLDINMFSIFDSTNSRTKIGSIDTSQFRRQSNKALKQAVSKIGRLSYKEIMVRYDINGNGVLDNTGTRPNEEWDSIVKYTGWDALVHVSGVVSTDLLVEDAEKKSVKLDYTGDIKPGPYVIYKKNLVAVDTVWVKYVDHDNNTVRLKTALENEYHKGDYFSSFSYAGLVNGGRDKIATFSNLEPIHERNVTALHEFLHLPRYGGLADVDSKDNVMHFQVHPAITEKRLRHRKLKTTKRYVDPHSQWEYIHGKN